MAQKRNLHRNSKSGILGFSDCPLSRPTITVSAEFSLCRRQHTPPLRRRCRVSFLPPHRVLHRIESGSTAPPYPGGPAAPSRPPLARGSGRADRLTGSGAGSRSVGEAERGSQPGQRPEPVRAATSSWGQRAWGLRHAIRKQFFQHSK